MLTLEQVKNVGIPKNTSKLNNKAYTPAAMPNDSVNLYTAIKLVIDEVGANANVTGNITHASTNVTLTLNGNTFVFNAANGSSAGVLTADSFNTLTSLVTLSGVSALANNLGTFTGTVIPDNSTIKAALQSLETSLQASAGTTFSITHNSANVVLTLNGTPYTINSSSGLLAGVITASQVTALNASIDRAGISASATHFGTFTGTTIPDSSTIKGALQALETALEALPGGGSGNTDLSTTYTTTTATVVSSTGTDAVINSSTNFLAGLLSAANNALLEAVTAAVGVGTVTHLGNNGALLPLNSNLRLTLQQLNYWMTMSVPATSSNTVSGGSITLGNEKSSDGIIKKVISVAPGVAGTVTILLNSVQGPLNNPPIENQTFIIYGQIGSSGTITFTVTSGEFLVYLKEGVITNAPTSPATYSITAANRYYKFEVVLHNSTFYLTQLV